MPRRAYLDWLRGVAVLVMVEAHLFDAWTAPSDRETLLYQALIFLGGFGAPAFLFLAGVAMPLAASSRTARGLSPAAVLACARRRGWQLFGLAFLFRAQAWVISGGRLPFALLKVDILNILGLSMLGAAYLSGAATTRRHRVGLLVTVAAGLIAFAPELRASAWLAALPDPLLWYVRPWEGRSSFTLVPWPAFLLAGAAVGEWLAGSPAEREAAVTWRIGALGVALVCVGAVWAAGDARTWDERSLWTVAPSHVSIRLGILMIAVPLARAWCARVSGWSPLTTFGVSSLFVYWVHVEMVYGRPVRALHRSLTLEQAVLAYVAFCAFLLGLVLAKSRLIEWRGKPSPAWRQAGGRTSA
ncbi:MAG: DUF1624 domain-containing protein [Acidobacteria bacterium]|nr:DUF1624 domain-containing protein [Acidobacteriota bacterium]